MILYTGNHSSLVYISYIIFVQKNIRLVSANRNPGMCLQMCVPEQVPRSAEQRPCQRIEFWIDPFCVARVSDWIFLWISNYFFYFSVWKITFFNLTKKFDYWQGKGMIRDS